MATTITPGGRVGNDRSIGSRSNGENWVEQEGGLPRYIRIVRNGLMKSGMSKGKAHAFAIAAIKRWAKGGDSVTPKVQAAAAAAAAQWAKMKASANAKGWEPYDIEETAVSDAEFKAAVPDTLLQELHDLIDHTSETKDDATMPQMEHKSALGNTTGLTVVDEKKGIVEAFVSVTGIRDNVKDIIHPGAYEKSLATRKPKGVFAHKWDMPIAKALEVKELLPGDKALPKTLPNGNPWPREAGALWVKMQFNMKSQAGKEQFHNVVFYEDEQEWSIGYQVPAGAARIDSKTGVRHIDYLELYEFSPVLFGAMPAARTSSVKDALAERDVASMTLTEFKEFCYEHGIEFKGDQEEDDDFESKGARKTDDLATAGDDTHQSEDDAEDWTDDEDDEPEEKALFDLDGLEVPRAYEYDYLVKARDTIDYLIKQADAARAGIDLEETKGLADIVDAQSQALGDYAEEMKDAAEAFDTAYDLGDTEGMLDFGGDVIDLVEKAMEDTGEDNALKSALQKVAAGVASMAPDEEAPEDEEEDEPEVPEDEDDTEKKPLPVRKKDAFVMMEAKDFEALRVGLTTNSRR